MENQPIDVEDATVPSQSDRRSSSSSAPLQTGQKQKRKNTSSALAEADKYRRRSHSKSHSEPISNFETLLLKKMDEPSTPPKKMDEIDHFCLSLAGDLRGMTTRQCRMAKFKIQQVIMEMCDEQQNQTQNFNQNFQHQSSVGQYGGMQQSFSSMLQEAQPQQQFNNFGPPLRTSSPMPNFRNGQNLNQRPSVSATISAANAAVNERNFMDAFD